MVADDDILAAAGEPVAPPGARTPESGRGNIGLRPLSAAGAKKTARRGDTAGGWGGSPGASLRTQGLPAAGYLAGFAAAAGGGVSSTS